VPVQIDIVTSLCSSARPGASRLSDKLPELMVNQPSDAASTIYYNADANERTAADDDMEIIGADILHDDFVQLDFSELTEQQNLVGDRRCCP
jgi:hypothetical protein